MLVVVTFILCGFYGPFVGILGGACIFGFDHLASRFLYVLAFYFMAGIAFAGAITTEHIHGIDAGFGVLLCALGIGGWPLGIFALVPKRKRRQRGNICAQCGYDLRVPTDRCPECGGINEQVSTIRIADALAHVELSAEPEAAEDTRT